MYKYLNRVFEIHKIKKESIFQMLKIFLIYKS